MDLLLEWIEDMFERGIIVIPVENIYEVSDLERAMIDAELASNHSPEQKLHTIRNIVEYRMADEIWAKCPAYHWARRAVLIKDELEEKGDPEAADKGLWAWEHHTVVEELLKGGRIDELSLRLGAENVRIGIDILSQIGWIRVIDNEVVVAT